MKKPGAYIIILILLVLSITEVRAGFFSFQSSKDNNPGIDALIKAAIRNLKDPVNVIAAKTYIDSAEIVCRDAKIDFPPMLDLVKAEYFMISKDYGTASQEATTALRKAQTINDKLTEAKTYSFFGKYYLNTGFFTESISNFRKSIDVAEKGKLEGVIPMDYQGMAAVYNALKKLPEYRDMLVMSIDAAKKEKDTAILMSAYWRLGSMYAEADRNFSLADSILRQCATVATESGDSTFNGLAWANIGWNYYLDKEYDSAIVAYNKSLKYSIPAKKFSNSANSFGNLGTIHRDLGIYTKALDYYDKGIEQATLAKDNYVQAWIYHDMSDLYILKRDTSNAYKYFVLFKKFNDIYLQSANVKGLDDASARFQAESHRKEVELLSLKLRNQRLIIFGSTGLLVLVLLVFLLLYSRARINAKRKITEMDHRISELTQANLRQQMNPHFIFNTLNSIQYYMYQHDKLATNNYLTKFSSLMRKILENSVHTSIPIQDELDALKLYLDLEMLRFKEKFNYSINVDEDLDPVMYKIPTMLIQPYVENSLCHGLIPAERKGLINIALKLENDYISCTIEDNGIGRKAAQERKDTNAREHSSLGTKITTSRLDLVNALCGTCLKTIYSDLFDDAGNAAGTRVEIHIPIMS